MTHEFDEKCGEQCRERCDAVEGSVVARRGEVSQVQCRKSVKDVASSTSASLAPRAVPLTFPRDPR